MSNYSLRLSAYMAKHPKSDFTNGVSSIFRAAWDNL